LARSKRLDVRSILTLSPSAFHPLRLSDFRSGIRVRVAIGLACFALLLQAMLPMAHFGPPRGSRSSIPDWVLASICGVDPGSVESGHAGGEPSTIDRLTCPVCLGIQLASCPPPQESIAFRPPALIASIGYQTSASRIVESARQNAAQPRAPPPIV
jgi:hypothetical protein